MNFPFEISRQKSLREHQQMYIMYEIFTLICEKLPQDDFPAAFRDSPGLSELPSGIRAEKAQSSFVYMINFFSAAEG